MQERNTFHRGIHPSASQGFTMIELMIVVAIIGIMASIAYPIYGNYAERARRSDGQLALLQAVQSMERCKATNYSFTNCALPVNLQTSPEAYYDLTVAKTASTYTVTATAKTTGQQAGDTDCGTMSLNSVGSKTPTDASKKCWPD